MGDLTGVEAWIPEEMVWLLLPFLAELVGTHLDADDRAALEVGLRDTWRPERFTYEFNGPDGSIRFWVAGDEPGASVVWLGIEGSDLEMDWRVILMTFVQRLPSYQTGG